MNLVFTILVGIAILVFVVGIALAMIVNVRVSHQTPGFWRAMVGTWADWFATRGEAGQRARIAERETALGRLANRLLQLGTALGLLLAVAFGLLRLFGVDIHAL